MPLRSYSLAFTLKGQPLRLRVYRLLKLFGWSIALTRLEKQDGIQRRTTSEG